MKSAPDLMKRAAYVLVGALFYTVLNWVPIVGALAVGFFIGYCSGGGFKRGFRDSLSAAILGAVIVLYLIVSSGVVSMDGKDLVLTAFIYWVILVWNIIAALVAGVGGGMGAWGKNLWTLIPDEWFDDKNDRSGTEYVICESCGHGNVSTANACMTCGKRPA